MKKAAKPRLVNGDFSSVAGRNAADVFLRTVQQRFNLHDLAGYSILEAVSRDAMMELLQGHPHFHTPGGQVEVHEMLSMPGT